MTWNNVGFKAVDLLGYQARGGAEGAGVDNLSAFICKVLSEESGVNSALQLFFCWVVQIDV